MGIIKTTNFMIGAAISAGLGLAGTVMGGIKAGQERKRMQSYLSGMNADNEGWYNKEYYGDYTQRSDTQALIKNMRDTMREQTKRTESTAAITGATPEMTNVAKENANKVISDTYSRVGAMGQQYKDKVQDRYMSRKQQLNAQEMDMMNQSAGSYENLMSNSLSGMMSGVAGALTTPTDNAIAGLKPENLQQHAKNKIWEGNTNENNLA